jgi:hypothetical protein
MARIGRQVDHFEEIDIQSIRADFSPDYQHRFTLIMRYRDNLLNNGRSRTVTVILKNPSAADEKRSDSTIRKVETYVWHHFPDARRLNILNIFGFRATDAVEVNQRLAAEGADFVKGTENDRFFREILGSTDYLICAWGGPSGIDKSSYSKRILEVKELVKSNFAGPVFEVRGTQETIEPLHGLMWGYDYTLKPFAL